MKTGCDHLLVWREAMNLTAEIYAITGEFPLEQRYVLSSQMQRSALSIASNIAEGQGRRTRHDREHYVTMARGSLLELRTQLLLAQRLGYMSEEACERLADRCGSVGRLLTLFWRSQRDSIRHTNS